MTDNFNQETSQETKTTNPLMLIAYQVIERGTGSKKQSFWARIGVAFPHRDGKPGFNVQLDAMPLDGRVVLLPPREKEEKEEKAS